MPTALWLARLWISSHRLAFGILWLVSVLICGIGQKKVHVYFDGLYLIRSVLSAVLIFCAVQWVRRHQWISFFKAVRPQWIAYLITPLFLIRGVFSQSNLQSSGYADIYHLPFTLGEFAAVLGGRTPWVDFSPLYQVVTPYLFLPIFKITGLTVFSYTAAMGVLSVVFCLCVFKIFSCLAQSAWIALGVYWLWLALTCFPTTHRLGGAQYLFTYYAVGPLRLFFPFIVAYLLLKQLQFPKRSGIFLVSLVAALGALNNLDFGVPALAAAVASLFWCQGFNKKGVVSVLVGISGVILFFIVGTLLRSGQFPDFFQALSAPQTFARFGYLMLPMPKLGLHWILLMTHLICLVLALAKPKRDSLTGMMIYSSIFGAGSFSYYVGRSHWEVLVAMFPGFGLTVGLLAFEWIERLKSQNSSQKSPLALIFPAVYLLAVASVALPRALSVPSPWVELRRFLVSPNQNSGHQELLVQMIRELKTDFEKVMIIYPFGHQLALRSGVDNLFPYTQDGSLILKSQVDRTIDVIDRSQIKKVFGRMPMELQQALQKLRFVKVKSLDDFEAWIKVD